MEGKEEMLGRKLESKIFLDIRKVIDILNPHAAIGPAPNMAWSGKLALKLVTTNGAFDILHAGHVKYLQKAKALGQILLVLVNTDASVKRYKGEDRPYNCLEHRMLCLAALESVDYVVPFAEDTPIEMLVKLYEAGVGPHFHVKGGDWIPEKMPETEIIRAYVGKLEIIPFEINTSTTALIKRIKGDTKIY